MRLIPVPVQSSAVFLWVLRVVLSKTAGPQTFNEGALTHGSPKPSISLCNLILPYSAANFFGAWYGFRWCAHARELLVRMFFPRVEVNKGFRVVNGT